MSARIRITIADNGTRAAFTELARRMQDTSPVMRTIGVGLVAEAQDRFTRGVDPGGAAWTPLNPDYALAKRGPGILRESGMAGGLMGSLTFRAGRSSVEMGSNKIYAAIHQFGGTIRPKAAGHLVFRLGGNRTIFASSVTLPPRPYLGIGARDEEMIGDTIEAYLSVTAPAGRGRGRR